MGVESPPGFPGTSGRSTGQHGGVRLGCGFRQPNSETEFGASVMVTPPYECNTGSAQQRADVGIRPFSDGRGFGPPYLGHGLRRPNFVPKFGASVKSSAPTESPINHPSQPARSEASAPAAARDGRESTQRPSQKGKPAATAGAALSEAESAERGAGQIQSLPDTLRVQHGVLCPEVSARPRPCSRWYHLN